MLGSILFRRVRCLSECPRVCFFVFCMCGFVCEVEPHALWKRCLRLWVSVCVCLLHVFWSLDRASQLLQQEPGISTALFIHSNHCSWTRSHLVCAWFVRYMTEWSCLFAARIKLRDFLNAICRIFYPSNVEKPIIVTKSHVQCTMHARFWVHKEPTYYAY